MPRRRLLALSGGLALSALAGCTELSGSSGFGGSARCLPRDTLTGHRTLAGAPLVYEPSRRQATFWFDPAFFAQLGAWATTLAASSGAPVDRWRTYGSWTDGGSACDSWHNSGRAFDLAGVGLRGDGVISCRYDQWRTAETATLASSRRAYWILAAGLHRNFAYVLTYLYNDQHANHIHVDNGRSGSGLSTFSTRSQVQVQAVQAITSYLWNDPVELTGRWDSATRRASTRVLDRLGVRGGLADDAANWRTFLDASASLPRD